MDIPAAPTYEAYISVSRASGSYNIPAEPTYGVYISQFLGLVVSKDRHSSGTYIWSIHLSVSRASDSYNIPAAPVYGVYISQFLGLVVPITLQEHLHM
jgi:hypothetical protein